MRKHLLAAAVLCATANLTSAALLVYEPFDGAPGALLGQSNASSGTSWQRAASSATTNALNVVGGSLTPPAALPAASGNALAITGAGSNSGGASRLGLYPHTTPSTLITSGTVYYSLVMKVTETTGSNTTVGGFFIGLNNTDDAPTTTNPSVVTSRIQMRQDAGNTAGKYNLEIVGNRAAAAGDANWAAAGSLNVGDAVFLVGAYDFASNTANLWVNPDSSTFGQASAPAANQSDATGTAMTAIGSIIMRQSPAPYMTIDDLRVGTTWADVTPVPEPAALSLAGLGAAGLLARRRRGA